MGSFDNRETSKWLIDRNTFVVFQRNSEVCRSPEFNNLRFQLKIVSGPNKIVFVLRCLQGTPRQLTDKIIVFNDRLGVCITGAW